MREAEIGVVVGPFAPHSVRHGNGCKLHRTAELHIFSLLLLPIRQQASVGGVLIDSQGLHFLQIDVYLLLKIPPDRRHRSIIVHGFGRLVRTLQLAFLLFAIFVLQ